MLHDFLQANFSMSPENVTLCYSVVNLELRFVLEVI
jgi:hypothetical protein